MSNVVESRDDDDDFGKYTGRCAGSMGGSLVMPEEEWRIKERTRKDIRESTLPSRGCGRKGEKTQYRRAMAIGIVFNTAANINEQGQGTVAEGWRSRVTFSVG